MKKQMKNKLFLLLLIGAVTQQVLAQNAKINTSLYAGLAAGYTPWKSFSQFRKEYNSVNAASVKNKLGSLSEQYGTELGIECFITRHFYASVEWNHLGGRTSAKFNNDSKRYFSVNSNAINCFIGWKQFTPKGAWIIATGFGALFGHVNGWVKFPGEKPYYSTEGFSGEFTDINIGIPLKFDYERVINEKFSWKLGIQGQFYTATFEEGMQNVFTTKTAGSISLNDKTVRLDLTGVTLSAGIVYNFYTLWED